MAPLYVFLGGGLGSLCRYGISLFFPGANSHYGTLVANFLACLLLGFLAGIAGKGSLGDQQKLLLMTGFCGGFSTFSTFSQELIELHDLNGLLHATGHTVLSILVGVISILLGLYLSGLLGVER